MSIDINADKILEKLNMGRGFRAFGGLSLLISIWVNNTLALKISLITFAFGAFARTLEMLNKLYPNNVKFQVIVWFLFTILYLFLINRIIQII